MLGDLRRVLVVAAHPDDEVLGVGGTIPILVANGANVTVLIVTDGSSTQYPEDGDVPTIKRGELHAANRLMGTTTVVEWDFPDMRLDTVTHCTLNDAFSSLIEEGGFDSIFVHGSTDINLDHRMVFHSVMVAARPFPGQIIRHVLSYHVNSSTEWGAICSGKPFAPNLYVDITQTIDTKVDAMGAYTSELRPYPHPRSVQALRERAAVFGSEVGLAYAEPFRVVLSRWAPGA